jgi:predicted RNase H-like HicB family nuclease
MADMDVCKKLTRSRRYAIVLAPTVEDDEVGYTVTVPSLPGCITEGDTLDEALSEAREVISLFLETLEDLGRPIPPSDEMLTHPLSDEIITSVEVDAAATALAR